MKRNWTKAFVFLTFLFVVSTEAFGGTRWVATLMIERSDDWGSTVDVLHDHSVWSFTTTFLSPTDDQFRVIFFTNDAQFPLATLVTDLESHHVRVSSSSFQEYKLVRGSGGTTPVAPAQPATDAVLHR